MMCGLFRIVNLAGTADLAIVGMTKNVGKTVTLNYLIDNFSRSGTRLGLLSAGYDGERFDRLTLREKPRIFAPAGAVVATAAACFEASEAVLDLLLISSFCTPLGEVYIGRVKEAGLIELAGPGNAAALRALMDQMKEFHAEQILLDGAINRIASASPFITGATILATGASLGQSLDDVVGKTIFRCNILETPVVEDSMLLKVARKSLDRGEAALLCNIGGTWDAEILHAPIPLLVKTQLIRKYRKEATAIVLKGALIDEMLLEISKLSLPPPAVIISDATKSFVTPGVYNRYLQRGGKIAVLQPIKLLAITVNPTNPAGSGYEPRKFLRKLRTALAPRPVFDLIFEGDAAIV